MVMIISTAGESKGCRNPRVTGTDPVPSGVVVKNEIGAELLAGCCRLKRGQVGAGMKQEPKRVVGEKQGLRVTFGYGKETGTHGFLWCPER